VSTEVRHILPMKRAASCRISSEYRGLANPRMMGHPPTSYRNPLISHAQGREEDGTHTNLLKRLRITLDDLPSSDSSVLID
jgi:hypothetical protein